MLSGIFWQAPCLYKEERVPTCVTSHCEISSVAGITQGCIQHFQHWQLLETQAPWSCLERSAWSLASPYVPITKDAIISLAIILLGRWGALGPAEGVCSWTYLKIAALSGVVIYCSDGISSQDAWRCLELVCCLMLFMFCFCCFWCEAHSHIVLFPVTPSWKSHLAIGDSKKRMNTGKFLRQRSGGIRRKKERPDRPW